MKTQNLLLFLFFTSLFSSCDNSVEPDEINYHNKILFTSSRRGIPQLFMMNPDGTDIRQITSGQYSHGGGRWSPDSKQIVASTDENWNTACYSHMVVMNSDGKNRKMLGCGSQMSWSPDGKKMLFSHCLNCELGGRDFGLFIINLNVKDVLQLPFNGGAPEWSPDGNRILFGAWTDSITQSIYYIVDYPNFTNIRTIAFNTAYPAWSPTGSDIVFSMQSQGKPNSEIFIMDTTGAIIQQVTNHQWKGDFYYPRWSSDGQKIIFISQYFIESLPPGTPPQFLLYMVNKDGTNLHKVIDDSTITSADWSQ